MAQEHQEYIQQKVNPILENLVTQVLLERPPELVPFMIKWLSEHAKTPAAMALTENVNELAELKTELATLEEEVKRLEQRPEAAADKQDDCSDVDDAEDEEEDDVADDAIMPPSIEYMKKTRASVSAEAYGAWNKRQEFTPVVYKKEDAQKERIRSVLQDSFLFSSLTPKDFDVVIDAMREKVVEGGAEIITQGDDGDCLFLIEEGLAKCYKKQPDGEPKLVKECKSGDAFGELALLYNCPRAASVIADERCVLWQLDRETFNHIVRDAASKRRTRYEEFLTRVPILSSLQEYERTTMCDVFRFARFEKGQMIVKQGDPGDEFFIVEEGECFAEKVYVEGTPGQEVMHYKSGDYFGELALLTNDPRAASVIAKTDCRLLSVSRKTFQKLLGPLEDLLKRNASQYK